MVVLNAVYRYGRSPACWSFALQDAGRASAHLILLLCRRTGVGCPPAHYKCNVSLNDAAARHRSTEAPHHFFIIMSIMVCMSFTLTMPLLPFFILSYMDS